MGVYSARSCVAASCTTVSELASLSVHGLGEVGGLSLRAVAALSTELTSRRAEEVRLLSPLSSGGGAAAAAAADGAPALSAGSVASGLSSAILQELGVAVGTYLDAARETVATARAVAGLLPGPELAAPLAALQETMDAFEAGLAVDAAEVRSLYSDAARHLLPVCTLLHPKNEEAAGGAAAGAGEAGGAGAGAATAASEIEAKEAKEVAQLESAAKEARAAAQATVAAVQDASAWLTEGADGGEGAPADAPPAAGDEPAEGNVEVQ